MSASTTSEEGPVLGEAEADHEVTNDFSHQSPPLIGGPEAQTDSVGGIDRILGEWTDREEEFAKKADEAKAGREEFLDRFRDVMGCVIKPAMEAIVQRLEEDGGDGAIWEGDSEAMHRPRVILWMSLKGKMSNSPRQDRNPYLQLDLDMARHQIDVWEGDMWENTGVSRATDPWDLRDITPEKINRAVMGILDRATNHTRAL